MVPQGSWLKRGKIPVSVALFFLIGIIACVCLGVQSSPERRWIAQSMRCFQEEGGFAGDFVHENISKLDKKTHAMEGEMWISSKGLLRMDYSLPSKKVIIFDGKKVMAYDEELQKAVVGSADSDLLFAGMQYLWGSSVEEVFEQFFVRVLKETKQGRLAVLELIPRINTPFVSRIVVTIGSCPAVKRIIVQDHAGNLIRLTMQSMKKGVVVSPKRFRFKLPSGANKVRP